MLHNYLKISFRNLIRNKGISAVNIIGLATGMACAILIFLFVNKQLDYDKSQLKRDRIYRLESSWVVMPPYLRETVKSFPEVEHAVRFFFWYEPTIGIDENVFTINNFGLVDSTVFSVFNFNFISGDPNTALSQPFSIVLDQSTATKLFGDEDGVGKMVKLYSEVDYQVTGVVEDVNDFQLEVNAFASISDVALVTGDDSFITSRNYNHLIYLLLSPLADIEALEEKIDTSAREADNYGGDRLILRPFNEIYFANNLLHEKNVKHGNLNIVLSFSLIGILIVVIACINFINLTIAKTSAREKEIAIRKASGARSYTIQLQFFGETFIVVLLSFILALTLVNVLLPSINDLTGEQLLVAGNNVTFVLIILAVLCCTILVSGIYPSYYLSRRKSILINKGGAGSSKLSLLSKILIAFQYTVSILLIIGTITIVRQLNFMQNKDLGIDHDFVLTTMLRGDKFSGEAEKVLDAKKAFEQELSGNPEFLGVTYLNQLPGKITNTYSFHMNGEKNTIMDTIPLRVINTDPAFVELMDIEILSGRNLSYDLSTDLGTKYLMNEEAAKQYGITDPVGSSLYLGDNEREVVGLVKDFHLNSLHSRIEPAVIVWDWWSSRACIKLTGKNLGESIRFVEKVYKDFNPGVGFEYAFLDETFARQYLAEQRLERILVYFVSIAIILSCLGLFALTTLITEQKTKEIGIRKVLGSTNQAIVMLVSNNFTRWIVLANVVAWPFAYVALSGWLETFEYRISLGITIFLLSGILVLVIAFITIAIQALKAAATNPAVSLKYE